jgi:hypothetical protein
MLRLGYAMLRRYSRVSSGLGGPQKSPPALLCFLAQAGAQHLLLELVLKPQPLLLLPARRLLGRPQLAYRCSSASWLSVRKQIAASKSPP